MTDHHRDEFEATELLAIAFAVGLKAEYLPVNPPKLVGFVKLIDGRFGYAIPINDFSALVQESRRTYRASEWQPIETAPKDGTSILGYRDGFNRISVWWLFNNRWNCDASYFSRPLLPPTHWMPFPAPPLAAQTQEGDKP